jgi:hypothetical protein
VLLGGVVIAVLLGGLSVWQAQATVPTCTHTHNEGVYSLPVCDSYGADRVVHKGRVDALRYTAAGVLLITLASIPLLRARERERTPATDDD